MPSFHPPRQQLLLPAVEDDRGVELEEVVEWAAVDVAAALQKENVVLPALIGCRATTDEAQESLAAVGLADRMHHLPAELSGGEQQRVAIARALTNNPDIIFADEPTGNLDSRTGDAIMDLLLNLARDRNKTLLVVTHDSRLAARGDRQLHIKDGVLQ